MLALFNHPEFRETLTPSGASASGQTTAPRGKCHLEAKDWEFGIALVVSRRYIGSQFIGYISANNFGSTSPSNGLGSALGSIPGSIDPGTDPIESELKSSIKPWMEPIGGPEPTYCIWSLDCRPTGAATGVGGT